jgi:hypothetical protein
VATRNHNHRLAKIHRSYTVEEVARLFGVHRNSVRDWRKQGLPVIDNTRPALIRGEDLGDFLRKRRQANKRPCAPGQLYCLRCRVPQRPADGRALYRPRTSTGGNLIGVCPVCFLKMHRSVNLAKLGSVQGDLTVLFPEAQEHISNSFHPSVNCDFKMETAT